MKTTNFNAALSQVKALIDNFIDIVANAQKSTNNADYAFFIEKANELKSRGENGTDTECMLCFWL